MSISLDPKLFTQLLANTENKPHKRIIAQIDSKMFSLDLNKVYNYKPERLAFEEYTRCLSLFESRNPGISPKEGFMRNAGIQSMIIKAEENHKEELQQLAIDTIREIYQVPNYIDLKAFIQPKLSLDTEQDHSPDSFLDLTLEQKNAMRDEIQKRIILNGLVHGSSMHVWKGIYHLVSEELERINPNLKELYNYYTSTMGIGIWIADPDSYQHIIDDGTQITLGLNKLKFDKEKGFGGQVEAKGINFPVLLHEVNKGVIDWLISAGIPKSYNERELTYYYSKADTYENEVWHYLLSPSLWTGLLEAAQLDNQSIPRLISKLTKLSYNEIVELFRLIQDDKEKATQKIKSWKI